MSTTHNGGKYYLNYTEALDYIHNTLKFGIKLGLHNMEVLLGLMGNPHKKLKFVHVAGTNGKGSTVAFISSILIESGYKVGIYTSPYIERFTERMKVNHDEISHDSLIKITEYVKSKVEIMVSNGENHPTEFEIVTAIAFQYFLESSCDIVVLEVGLGGRFDSTNVIGTPLVSVITTISFDHMDILGHTLAEIAYEKAGIIKKNGDVVIYPQEKSVEKVFYESCESNEAKLHSVDFSDIKLANFDIKGQEFSYDNYSDLKISLLGDHQVKNAVIAIKAAEVLINKGFNITMNSLRNGLLKAKWNGRFEIINLQPVFIIDGAHNQEGAAVLVDSLNKYFPDKRKIFIVGVLKDKDYKAVIKSVMPIASQFIVITPESPRALKASELAIIIEDYCKNVLISDTIEEAIRVSLEMASETDVICAFGSFTHIGIIRETLLKSNL
jgi:dihydrofolate synthase / folylpolyglutamate synthase